MVQYRRNRAAGGCYFFTGTLQDRRNICLTFNRQTLRKLVIALYHLSMLAVTMKLQKKSYPIDIFLLGTQSVMLDSHRFAQDIGRRAQQFYLTVYFQTLLASIIYRKNKNLFSIHCDISR